MLKMIEPTPFGSGALTTIFRRPCNAGVQKSRGPFAAGKKKW